MAMCGNAWRRTIVAGLVLSAMVLVSAGPATQPATRPSQETPQGTLRSFTMMMGMVDRTDAREVLYAANAMDQQWVEFLSSFFPACWDFREALIQQFGQKVADEMVPGGKMDPELLRWVDRAEVKVDGDKATVGIKGAEPDHMNLVRVKGKWMVARPWPMWLGADDNDLLEKRKVDLAVIRETTAGVKQGKFKTAEEAGADYERKLQERLSKLQEKDAPK